MVVRFNGAVSGYRVLRQGSARFVQDPRGNTVTLSGSAGLRLRLEPASAYGTYSGSSDLKPGLTAIREARQVGDFEAVTSWGVGLSRASCIRVFSLANPSRLVIDVQH